jgi:hypothetical protein
MGESGALESNNRACPGPQQPVTKRGPSGQTLPSLVAGRFGTLPIVVDLVA